MKIFRILLSTVTLFVLAVPAGCKKKGPVEISFWHVMAAAAGDSLDKMIAEYNQTNPGVVVKAVNMGSYDALIQKLLGAVSAGSPPVMSQLYEAWTDEFYAAGQLMPLENFLKNEPGFSVADFYPIFIEDNTYDSVLVTLPFNKSVPVIYYNRDMFDQAGIVDFPSTWTEFREAARRLKVDRDKDGVPEVWPTSWPIDVWYLSTMIRQNGGELFDVGKRQALYNSPAAAEVLNYVVGLVKEDLLYLVPGFQRQDEFIAGRIAMIPASIATLSFLRDRVSFRMGIAPMPIWKQKATTIAGTNIGIFARSTEAQQREAWKFIKWLLSLHNQLRWTRASCYLPLSKGLLDMPEMQAFLQATPGYQEIINELNFGRIDPMTRDWYAGRSYLVEAMEAAIRGKYSAQEALNIAAEKTTKDIRKQK